MNKVERRILNRGIAAGTLIGLATGGIIALVIVMRTF